MMSADANFRVADAFRRAAMRLDEAFLSGQVVYVYANQLAETLLMIAEDLDPPLPTNPDARSSREDNLD
jgi:hypothetical protein